MIPIIQNAMSAGEFSPALYGRSDLEKFKHAASTYRNGFSCYRGGYYSRGGTKYVGQCKQGAFGLAATVLPPVCIPYQFSVTQGINLEFGDKYVRFVQNGAYIVEAAFAVSAATNANPGLFTATGNNLAVGDWVYLSGLGGMLNVDGNIYVVNTVPSATNTFTLKSTLTGNVIDTTGFLAYTSGGTVARIYELATPYAVADLPALKWTQSADVMSLTHPSYPPYDLARITNSHWTLTMTMFASSIAAPATSFVTASTITASNPTNYQYAVTAIDQNTGEESVASPIASVTNSVNIAAQLGSETITWSPVTGASSYNIYKAPPAYGATVPVGSIFAYAGTALGLSFVDTNVTGDSTTVPPTHQNPFATSSIFGISMSNFGAQIATASGSIAGSTGSGFSATPVIIGGQIQWWVINNEGQGYTAGSSFSISQTFITTSGSVSAAGSLLIGPSSGTWPSCVAYFQQRRFYANTNNSPDTYYASQPGAFRNMDISTPVQDDDAIVGTPWAQQVNGIQAMVPMPNGLVILTGLGAWQLSGGNTVAVTPSNQIAVPQAYNGCAPTIRPLTINYDILYVQEKGSIVRDLSYNFFVNIYTGTDMTVLSNHLFDGFTIVRWDWSEEPYKLVWVVRNDGILLCLTYLKEQDVYAWSRHDTNGLFQSVACVSEPPVNAPYFIVKRLIQGDSPTWAYYMERMDNRLWQNIEQCWCVDAGLSYPMPTPNAMLSASSSAGVPTLQTPQVAWGGQNYSNLTYAEIIDPTGQGAAVTLTITAGVITAATLSGTLTGYTVPTINVIDPTNEGGGAIINVNSLNIVTFTASSGVFGSNNPGDVVRMGGGIAVAQTVTSTQIVGYLTAPITTILLNDPLFTPVPASAGNWTITTPAQTIYGLDHLEGMTVSILADGYVIQPMTVSGGAITLPNPATAIVIGLPFVAQLQTLYLEMQSPATVQTRRKNIYNAVIRVERTRDIQIGANEPDSAVQPNFATLPWTNMDDCIQPNLTNEGPVPLFTGDIFANVTSEWDSRGQVALQQVNPLPMQIEAIVTYVQVGDSVSADQ